MPSETAAAGEYFQTQLALLKTRTLAERVITDLGLEANSVFASTNIVGSNFLKRLRAWVLTPVRFLLDFLSWFKPGNLETNSASTVDHQQTDFAVDAALINRYMSFVDVQPVATHTFGEASGDHA